MKKELPSFDEMVKLAQENPEQLEEIRAQMCEAIIQSAPEKLHRKLRGLQFKIDMERRRAKSPLASCVRISQMMHDSFSQLRTALNELNTQQPVENLKGLTKEALINKASTKIAEKPSAEVFEFPN